MVWEIPLLAEAAALVAGFGALTGAAVLATGLAAGFSAGFAAAAAGLAAGAVFFGAILYLYLRILNL